MPVPGSCYEAVPSGCYGNRGFLLRSGSSFLCYRLPLRTACSRYGNYSRNPKPRSPQPRSPQPQYNPNPQNRESVQKAQPPRGGDCTSPGSGSSGALPCPGVEMNSNKLGGGGGRADFYVTRRWPKCGKLQNCQDTFICRFSFRADRCIRISVIAAPASYQRSSSSAHMITKCCAVLCCVVVL